MDTVQLANPNLGENNSVKTNKKSFTLGTILIFLNHTALGWNFFRELVLYGKRNLIEQKRQFSV